MKRFSSSFKILMITFLFFNLALNAQSRFQKGYYILNNGERYDVEIEKKEWTSWSNTTLIYRVNGNENTIPISELKEFGVTGKLKFVTAEVEIEKSSNFEDQMDSDPEFKLNRERVLLKVLVEDQLSLYLFLNTSAKKFFIKNKNEPITQLLHKFVRIEDQDQGVIIKENNAYLEVLKTRFNCGNYDYNDLRYETSDLVKFIVAYNKCVGKTDAFVSKVSFEPTFVISPNIGLGFYSFDSDRGSSTLEMNSIVPVFGLDINYFVPAFNNEIIIGSGISYTSFSTDGSSDFVNQLERNADLDYQELLANVHVGYRFILRNTNAISLGMGYYFPLSKSDVSYSESPLSEEEFNGNEISGGLGFFASYTYRKFRLTVLVGPVRDDVLTQDTPFNLSLDRSSIKLGYDLGL